MEEKDKCATESCNHNRRRGGRHRRVVIWSLSLILLFTIPLCLVVFVAPPKVIVFWWAEDYDQDGSTTKKPENVGDRFDQARFASSFAKKEDKKEEIPKVLLISYDGFRWDYIQKNNATPTLRWLIANGVFAPNGLKNTFITITAPNHYGIVTGLYEESHGIVANDFFGPEFNERFDYFDTRTKTDPRFFGGEPVWVTNDRAGPGRATGCQMWTGCDLPIMNHTIKHFTSWDGDLSWIIRVDSIITWFKDPVDPINLGLLYIEEPDETGHEYGPDDPKTAAMVQKLDQLTAYLLWRLYSENLLDKVNLIFTADHGMAAVPWANVVNLDQYVNRSDYTVYGGTPNWNVLPAKGKEKEIYEALVNKVPHLFVYNKTTIPKEYHYTNTPHVLPLQFVAYLHWRLAHNDTVTTGTNEQPIYERKTRGRILTRKLEISNATVGEHGYNNSLTDMHPFFIAYGPAFKKGYNATQFMNLDIYPLMCHILGVKPAPNNGSFDRVRSILKNNGEAKNAKVFEYNRAFMKANEVPPWAANYASGYAPTTETSHEYSIKVVRHYLPFTYSVNFDIFVMTLLLLVYVAIMIALSERVRRNRHRDHHRLHDHSLEDAKKIPIQPTTTGEKSMIINVVA